MLDPRTEILYRAHFEPTPQALYREEYYHTRATKKTRKATQVSVDPLYMARIWMKLTGVRLV